MADLTINELKLTKLGCCGIVELDGFGSQNDPAGTLRTLDAMYRLHQGGSYTFGMIIFSETSNQRKCARSYEYFNGKGPATNFFEFIQQNALGPVDELKPFCNPNTGHIIYSYTWYIDREAVRKWIVSDRAANPNAYVWNM